MDRDFDKRAVSNDELRTPKDALIGVTPPLGLLAVLFNGTFALYTVWISDSNMAWVFGIFGLTNVAIMLLPLWWRKVDSRRASVVMLVAVFAIWIANANTALRYALALYSVSLLG
jgi:hypothetical protein